MRRTITQQDCNRCGHQWWPRKLDGPALYCPECKSPYYNKPRVRRRPQAAKVSA